MNPELLHYSLNLMSHIAKEVSHKYGFVRKKKINEKTCHDKYIVNHASTLYWKWLRCYTFSYFEKPPQPLSTTTKWKSLYDNMNYKNIIKSVFKYRI